MSIFNLIETKIENSIEKNSDLLDGKPDDLKQGSGFMLYSLGVLFKNIDPEEIEAGIVDSAFRGETHDYGIDAIYLTGNNEIINSPEELEEYDEYSKFEFHILQFKKGKSVDQATLLKFKEGLREVFILNNCSEEKNQFMYDRINLYNEIKNSLYEKFSSSQISIHLYLVFGGVKEIIERDSLLTKQIAEAQRLLSENAYQNNIYEIVDAQKLVDLDKKGEEIIDIIKYHKTLKYITEIENDKKLTGYISIINAEEIANLVKSWQTALFEANIRDYYRRNDLNSKIFKTCTSEKDSKYFWSFNNGLTITCRKVEELPNDKYRLHGIQIVNGCQTSNALYKALHNRERYQLLSKKAKDELAKNEFKELEDITNKFLNPKTSILVKIIETNDPELIYRITETTNSQTPIKTFSLKANDNIQQNIEQYLLEKEIYYERRVNYYKNQGKKNTISIQKLFQLYCSQILFKPSQVKTNPKSMFQTFYDEVFPSPNVKQMNYLLYLVPIKLDIKLNKHIRTLQRSRSEIDPYKAKLMSYGKLHLGCFILNSILTNGYNEKEIIDNEAMINEVLDDDLRFTNYFDIALELV